MSDERLFLLEKKNISNIMKIPKLENSIFVIHPYLHNGTWVFDDKNANLVKEAFVSGVPEIFVSLHQKQNIVNPNDGFRLFFSSSPFPSFHLKCEWVQSEYDGNWYRTEDGQEGWLCPALFKYFETAPKYLYIRAESISKEVQVALKDN